MSQQNLNTILKKEKKKPHQIVLSKKKFISNTDAEFENHDNSEDRPDGILAELLLLDVYKQRNEGQREPRFHGEQYLPRVGTTHLVKL